jgi:hypothetical protein
MKTKRITVIVIDPIKETIEEMELDIQKDGYDAIAGIIGQPSIESLTLNTRKQNLLYVDSMGLLKPQEKYIKLKEYPSFLAGKAVVVGYKRDSYISHSIDLKKFQSELMFLTVKEAKALAHMVDQQNRDAAAANSLIYVSNLSKLFD